MRPDKIDALLRSARQQPPPKAPDDFCHRVMQQVRSEPGPKAANYFELINALFPRLAVGACLAIALCVLADVTLSSMQSDDFAEDVAQVSAQWLLP